MVDGRETVCIDHQPLAACCLRPEIGSVQLTEQGGLEDLRELLDLCGDKPVDLVPPGTTLALLLSPDTLLPEALAAAEAELREVSMAVLLLLCILDAFMSLRVCSYSQEESMSIWDGCCCLHWLPSIASLHWITCS